MATALVAAAAATVVVLAVAALALRAERLRFDRRIRALLEQVDRQVGAIAEILERVVSRSLGARAVDDLELTVDLDELLRRLAAQAATRTRASAALVRAEGVGGEQVTGTFGAEDGAALPHAPVGAGARPFRALTINWAYRTSPENADDAFTSVLVVPIVEDGVETGSIAAYARGSSEFGAEAVAALEELADEAGRAIASARRFAETERALTDLATGIRNRAGYEVELDRAVTHARSSGLPLSILVLRLGPEGERGEKEQGALEELASLLLRQTRSHDVVCRTSSGELGVLLPETTGEATRKFYGRLRDEAARLALSRQATFAAGLVEWRPNESSNALGARAAASVGRSRVEALVVGASGEEDATAMPPASRELLDARLTQAIGRARRLRQPLSLLLVDLDVEELEDRLGEEALTQLLENVEAHIAASLSNGDAACRVHRSKLAVMLQGSRSAQAEELFARIRSSLEAEQPSEPEHLALSAGITELVPTDDAATALDRAQHALMQARQAGRGTVVVAMANGENRAG
jgi:diguanylate cyclase (GGDEF)-like protein